MNDTPRDRASTESWTTKLVLLVIGAVIGAFVGEPIKNVVNRPRVDLRVISVESVTPSKGQRLLGLTPDVKAALASQVAGSEWVDEVRTDKVTFGGVESRKKKLQGLHDTYSFVAKLEDWKDSTGGTDYAAFYESHRIYIRAILEYVPNLPSTTESDRDLATNFLRADTRDRRGIFPIEIFGAPTPTGEPPRNARDIVLFAGKHQDSVFDNTKPLLRALNDAMASADLLEPTTALNVVVEATNFGGAATSIGSVGKLSVKHGEGNETAVALKLKRDADTNAVLPPGESKRFEFVADESVISDIAEGSAPPAYVTRANSIKQTQADNLKTLGPLYKSGAGVCTIALNWGANQESSAVGEFGLAQGLAAVERVLRSPAKPSSNP